MRHLQEQRRFPNSWFAADEDGGAGDYAAAENAVEFADAGGTAGGIRFVDLMQRQGLAASGDVAGLTERRAAFRPGIGRGGFVFFEAVPRAAVRAFAAPLGMDRAAGIAEELGAGFGHEVKR